LENRLVLLWQIAIKPAARREKEATIDVHLISLEIDPASESAAGNARAFLTFLMHVRSTDSMSRPPLPLSRGVVVEVFAQLVANEIIAWLTIRPD
jgi:hypothetical protein